jgi:hypothetical protein
MLTTIEMYIFAYEKALMINLKVLLLIKIIIPTQNNLGILITMTQDKFICFREGVLL